MRTVLSSGSSRSCPSLPALGGRGMSWKTNCRHYGTSSPHISWVYLFSAQLLLISMRAPHFLRVLVLFFSHPKVGHFFQGGWSLRAQVAAASGNLSTLHFFGFDPMEAADCGSAARNLRALWTHKPPGAVMFQWQTSGSSATNGRQTRQAWAAERSSSRAGSGSHRRRRNSGDM